MMSLFHTIYRFGMTLNQITFFFLKILNLGISYNLLTLKDSNLIFELLFELFPFFFVFFDETFIIISLSLELSLFLAK